MNRLTVPSLVMAVGMTFLASGSPQAGSAESPKQLAESIVPLVRSLEEADTAQVMLVPDHIRTSFAITPSTMAGKTCVFEATTREAISALIGVLGQAINRVTYGEAPGYVANTRTAIAFFKNGQELKNLYVAHGSTDSEWEVSFRNGTAFSSPALRARLEEWAVRPDVQRVAVPDSARDMRDYPCLGN